MADHEPIDDPTRADVPAGGGAPASDEPTRAATPAVDEPTMAMPVAGGADGVPPADLPPTDEPPAEPPDRRGWIIGALVALIAVVALAVLLLGGDDDQDAATVDTTTTVADTTTTTEPTTTATAPTTTTAAPTTTSAPPTTIDPARCTSSPPEDPAPTAQIFYEAFTVGDRDCAGQVGTASAVDTLFAIPGGGGGWTFQGCTEEDVPDPHHLCAYSFEGGSTAFRLAFGEFDGWTVYEVFQVAD